ncbi:MAG: ceramidase domain-containing protein [Gammaproteobacteria bacterium]|nr:ceramidase domain-containing protein [Gammaproteobacteria bacterium]
MIDLYCERLGPGFWSEPVNATTNLAFLVAAFLGWRAAKESNALSADVCVLIGLTALIAIGSGLFHTLATTWARWLDLIPILAFQLAYVWVYGRRMAMIRAAYLAAIVLGFLGTALWARQFPHLLNGSLTYAPAFVVLSVLGIYHFATRRTAPALLLAASGVFAVSLAFRTVDAAVCPYFPLGTHFLWHLLNALLLYLLLRGLLVNLRNARSR